ncbi:glucosaminidase domain-containing protein [Maribellus sediminis]|uniref:glucosaminidase domain-containing protein n=1 Tax=Maribellus sediminis TaxID=2696285 RepID=UPI00143146F1|nr:glucosaminidase domain-containing protein [Maribellus sediminis]
MRVRKLIISICILLILAGCANKKDQSSFEAEKVDTIPSTIPLNYLETIDKLDASQKYVGGSYKDMLDLFEKLNYTPEAWQAGIREVPRAYLVAVGDRWGTTTTKEITTLNKKQLFFRGLAPLILHANELILQDRNRLEKIKTSFQKGNALPEMDKIWILKLAKLYKVNTDDSQLTAAMFDELWKRVDIIPPSLALGQSATESGWGTSRFAAQGNAMYGQWAWGENAMKPENQRTHLGNYGVAAFSSLQESVSAYMLNLNTHYAYAELREIRANLRKKGQKITGNALADGLTRYSEHGASYVESLKAMMDYNRLYPADDAYLSDEPPIFLIPAAD